MNDNILIFLISAAILFFIIRWIMAFASKRPHKESPLLKRFVSLVETLEWEIAGNKFNFKDFEHEKRVKSYLRTDIPEWMLEVRCNLIVSEFRDQGYEKIPLSPSRVASSLSIAGRKEVKSVKDELFNGVKERAYKNKHWRVVSPADVKK
jgi:hypothetical protein